MARAELRETRDASEIGEAIVAAWFKVLVTPSGTLNENEHRAELEAVFAEILKTPVRVMIDPVVPDVDNPLVITVPQPPRDPADPTNPDTNVTTREELVR